MVEIGILQCPVCQKVHLSRINRVENTEQFKKIASDHLYTHLLDESKHGIYKLMMADRVTYEELSEATEIPISEWTTVSAVSPLIQGGDSRGVSLPQE